MSNAVETDKYRLHIKELMPLFSDENLKNIKVVEVKGNSTDYKIISNHYSTKIGDYDRQGVKCFLYKRDILHTQWYSFNDSAMFYQLISHKNGKEYLIFRQDLYGYSVLDIDNGKIMQFFPKCSFEGIEIFIWTSVDYNSENNVLAVSGCYWAWPDSVQLFLFDEPMADTPRFIDIISCLDGGYDVYDELTFLKWENGNLYLKAYLVKNLETTELIIPQEQYLDWLRDNKIAKYL